MQMSQDGLDNLLKKFEGCKLKAYRCPANVCTIGYGHTSAAGSPTVMDGMSITQAQAEEILRQDLVKYERSVQDLVKVELTQNQFDVLVDFAYNAGVGNLKSSTMLKKINSGDLDAVPDELMKWTKGGGKVLPGLVRRRQAAGAWWNADQQVEEHEQRADPDPVPVRTMADSKQGNAALLTAGLGTLGVAKEIAAQAKDASDTADQLMGLLHNVNFVIMLAIIGAGAAIWFWRKKHMDEHGV
ncbi:COG3772 Phage-related lysozyme (muraminidase) [uncultured Caudovirales phage]|jgi:lysozyme|uniref:Endolysin n=1 Tax=uncultured Caudovirales phage TaxID=2100421 RepID=A0A6J5TAI0_9CAUD|nr:COG3772 Phage-related lysozyme (muraminidase) [uncultured Caudovirales phage]